MAVARSSSLGLGAAVFVLALAAAAALRRALPADGSPSSQPSEAAGHIVLADNGTADLAEDGTALHPPTVNSERLFCMLRKRAQLKLANISSPGGKLHSRWRSCAVVSNSGVLARHHHGKEIDAADLVIRFNDAPLDGYTREVGRKDDLRFVNEKIARWALLDGKRPESVDPILADGAACVVVPITEAPNLDNLRKKHPEVSWYQIDNAMLRSFHAILHQVYWSDRWAFHTPGFGVKWPTSGAIGMLTAMTVCDEVRAYGMAASKGNYGAAYHYYGTGGQAHRNDYHKGFEMEKDVWRRLAVNAPSEIDKEDMVVIHGFSQAKCES